MKVFTLTLSILLLCSGIALAQLNCAQMGNFVSCDGPNGYSSTQTELQRNQGFITDHKGNMEPYLVMPTPAPARPLNQTLPTLPTLRPLNQPAASPQALQPSSPVFAPMGLGVDATP